MRVWITLLIGWMTATATYAGRMNVVLLYADDWRHDTLGAAGHPILKTPSLDTLAKRGVRFTENRVTTSVCGVSRATLLTGQGMSRHGNESFNMFKTPWKETFPGVLREQGYYLGHVGKWHCGKFPAERFDFARAYSGKHWMKDEKGNEVHVYGSAIRSHFKPDNIEGIRVGDKVYFHVTNLAQDWDVPHGFAIIGNSNSELLIMPGETLTITWEPKRVGIHPFYCTDFCSALHQEMTGYVRVSPSGSSGQLVWNK